MNKKLLSLLLAVAMILPLCPVVSLPVFATEVTSGTTGDCTWTLDGTKLTISGNGAMGDYTLKYVNGNYLCTAPWGSSVTEVIIEDGVTHVGAYSFHRQWSLTSVTLSDTLTSIGSYAFYACPFSSINLPETLISIGSDSFSFCTNLTSVTIPDSVTTISSYAFYYCSHLSDVYYEGTQEARTGITIESGNEDLTNATWHYAKDSEENLIAPVSAKLILDKYIGVKFYFNKAYVDEAFTYSVTLNGKNAPLAEGDFSDLTEEEGLYVLSFNGIGLSDFMTEFTLTGSTISDPNAAEYNSVYKLAELGFANSEDDTKEKVLFSSIVDLANAAAGKETEHGLTYNTVITKSSGKGAEEGASLSFTGKNLLMNDAIGLRLYGQADSVESVKGLKVFTDGVNDITSVCEISTPVYNEAKGKYTFTVDMFFDVAKMTGEKTFTVKDSQGVLCLELTDRIDWIAQMIITKEPDNTLAKQVLIYIQKANEYYNGSSVVKPMEPGEEEEIGGGKIEI